jgi:purine-binding chemotaxis protein CheW
MGAARQFATFTVGQLLFGIEIDAVQEVIGAQLITPVPLAPRAATGLINLRGQVVTAIDMRSRVGLAASGDPPMNVVVRLDNELVSLVVDEIGDVIDVTAEQFEQSPRTVSAELAALIRGAYKLDRQLLLVLDLDATV